MTLRTVGDEIAAVLAENGTGRDGYTRAHLQDLDQRIRRTLEAVTQVPAG